MSKPSPKPKPEKPDKSNETFGKILAQMPEDVADVFRGKPQPVEAQDRELDGLLAQLPDDVAQQLKATSITPAVKQVEVCPWWCVLLLREGHWPLMKAFRDREEALQRLIAEEGQEVSVWLFYGIPLQLTQFDPVHNCRYLLLPDKQSAVALAKGVAARLVPASLVRDVPVQRDGWLGHPDFSQEAMGTYYAQSAEAKEGGKDNDDEDGEEPSIG